MLPTTGQVHIDVGLLELQLFDLFPRRLGEIAHGLAPCTGPTLVIITLFSDLGLALLGLL